MGGRALEGGHVGLRSNTNSTRVWAFQLDSVLPSVYRFAAVRRGFYFADQALNFTEAVDIEIAMNAEAASAPVAPGNLVGTVHDQSSGDPVEGVQVRIIPTEQTALTDHSGSFTIAEISQGALGLELQRAGYEPRLDTLASLPGITLEVDVTMSTEPVQLDPIVVEIRPLYLEATGFYRRAQLARGHHFTAEEIMDRAPNRLADIFRRVPHVEHRRTSMRSTIMNTRDRCPMTAWLDGMSVPGFELAYFPPRELAAMEVYTGVEVPTEFFDRCGVILLWTDPEQR